ncbi:MAG: ROK family protein [Firmicutes bacterium]|jgi:glucokinase|nr:ROK family protein [Bacillota bacterium]
MSVEGGCGQPTQAYGVDIGGTKVAVGLVDAGGHIVRRAMEPLEASGTSPEITIAQVARLIHKVSDGGDEPRRPVGVGIPAVMDERRSRVVWAPNIPGWSDFPALDALSAVLGHDRVALEFDGITAVVAESWVGAARGGRDVVFLIIGTGIGAGLILGGRVHRGSTGMPGGVGWFAMDPAALDDIRTRRAPHFEELCAGPGLLTTANAACSKRARFPDTQALFEAYDRGDSTAVRSLVNAASYVGMAVANMVSILNPDTVVIGGGIGLQYCKRPSLFTHIQEMVSSLAQPAAAQAVRIMPALLGPDAGVIGAAKTAMDRFGSCANSDRKDEMR